MVITKYSTIFRGNNEQWNDEWSYPKIWVSGKGSNNDLNSYLHYIENPTQSSRYINEFIRIYMEKTEVKYPGYRLYIKGYFRL